MKIKRFKVSSCSTQQRSNTLVSQERGILLDRNSLVDAQNALRAQGIERIRQLTEALKKRFPFAYERAYREPGSTRTEALKETFGHAHANPTPFLPVVLFALMVDGAAGDLSEDEISMLAGDPCGCNLAN